MGNLRPFCHSDDAVADVIDDAALLIDCATEVGQRELDCKVNREGLRWLARDVF